MTDLLLQHFNAAFIFSIKFEAMCAKTSSNLGKMRFFLEIEHLLTTNTFLVLMTDELLPKLLINLQLY